MAESIIKAPFDNTKSLLGYTALDSNTYKEVTLEKPIRYYKFVYLVASYYTNGLPSYANMLIPSAIAEAHGFESIVLYDANHNNQINVRLSTGLKAEVKSGTYTAPSNYYLCIYGVN